MKIINGKLLVAVGVISFAVMCFDLWPKNSTRLTDLSVAGKIAMVIFCAALIYGVCIPFIAMIRNIFRKK